MTFHGHDRQKFFRGVAHIRPSLRPQSLGDPIQAEQAHDVIDAQAAGVPLALFTEGYRKAAVESLGAKLVFDDFRALPVGADFEGVLALDFQQQGDFFKDLDQVFAGDGHGLS